MHETYICSTGKISTCIQPVLSFRELHSLNRMWQIFLVGWLYLLCTISPSTSIVSFCYFFPSLSSFFSTRRTICCHNFWTLRICVPVCAVFGLIAQVFHVFFVRSCRMRDMKLYIFNESYARSLSLSPSLALYHVGIWFQLWFHFYVPFLSSAVNLSFMLKWYNHCTITCAICVYFSELNMVGVFFVSLFLITTRKLRNTNQHINGETQTRKKERTQL